MQAKTTWDEAYAAAKRDITAAREITAALVKDGFIKYVPQTMLEEALSSAVAAVKK